MSVLGGAPCANWEPIWCEELSPAAAAVTGTFIGPATEALWAASGRRFGLCEVTIRPCRRTCYGEVWPPQSSLVAGWGGGPWPALIGGQWYNLTCGGCGGVCSCTTLQEAVLPTPAHSIVEVKIDGTPLVTGSYRIDESRVLVRTDGGSWPLCQELDKADTEEGTWSVTLNVGEDVPELGKLALGELIGEMAKACTGEKCQLPRPVQSLVRQGVTMTFLDPNELFKNRRIGLYFSDLLVQTFNPHGLTRRSKSFNVDGDGYRIVGT